MCSVALLFGSLFECQKALTLFFKGSIFLEAVFLSVLASDLSHLNLT